MATIPDLTVNDVLETTIANLELFQKILKDGRTFEALDLIEGFIEECKELYTG